MSKKLIANWIAKVGGKHYVLEVLSPADIRVVGNKVFIDVKEDDNG